MKFRIDRNALLKPLQLVAGVVERRQTLPVLANVRVGLRGTQLEMTGTDLEVEIVARVVLAEAGRDGDITLPARKLLDICRSLPDDAQLDVAVDGQGGALITSGRSRFTLATLPASDFPSIENSPGRLEFNTTQVVIKQLIDSTAFAMAHQDVRYYLNGMLWEVGGGKLRVVATDGHRLAMRSTEVPLAAAEPVQAIVPRKGVVELGRLLGGEGDVQVIIGNHHLRVIAGDLQFTSKLVDGVYPDYDRVLPKGGKCLLVGGREELRQAFGRTSILSNEKYRGVRLMLMPETLRLVANNPEHEEAEEEVAVHYRGDQLEIGFNVGYIIDVLNVLKGGEVRFTFADANSSVLVEDSIDDCSTYVIMPMRL